MKTIELNRPALWRPIRSDQVSIRKYSAAYPYQIQSGVIARSTVSKPVVRYAKNFRKHRTDFSLFLFTHETDIAKVEKFFIYVVNKLKKEDISETLKTADMSNFKYMNTYYGGKI